MNCREFSDFIMAFLDADLPEEAAAEFERHLSLCPPCKHYLDGYRATVSMAGHSLCEHADDPVPDEPPEELVQAILAARRKMTE